MLLQGQENLRYDTAANWKSANPILQKGEVGVEADGAGVSMKVGDGSTAWNTLKYCAGLNFNYPIGHIWESFSSTNPGEIVGGTWEQLTDGRVLIAANSTYTAGTSGGEASHTLSVNEMPAHNHSPIGTNYATNITSGTSGTRFVDTGTIKAYKDSSILTTVGGGAAHNNMQPYTAVYRFRRTA